MNTSVEKKSLTQEEQILLPRMSEYLDALVESIQSYDTARWPNADALRGVIKSVVVAAHSEQEQNAKLEKYHGSGDIRVQDAWAGVREERVAGPTAGTIESMRGVNINFKEAVLALEHRVEQDVRKGFVVLNAAVDIVGLKSLQMRSTEAFQAEVKEQIKAVFVNLDQTRIENAINPGIVKDSVYSYGRHEPGR